MKWFFWRYVWYHLPNSVTKYFVVSKLFHSMRWSRWYPGKRTGLDLNMKGKQLEIGRKEYFVIHAQGSRSMSAYQNDQNACRLTQQDFKGLVFNSYSAIHSFPFLLKCPLFKRYTAFKHIYRTGYLVTFLISHSKIIRWVILWKQFTWTVRGICANSSVHLPIPYNAHSKS